jgi:dTDP-4-dehydrorhamnose 3,5-epimerase
LSIQKVNDIQGVRLIEAKSFADTRGTFTRINVVSELKNPLDSVGISSNPTRGTIRGLHFQIEPFAEEKLVSCVQGSIFDVIVDLRKNSPTYGKWTSVELSATNNLQLFIPKGIAHGFQTLLANSIVHYGLGAPYSPEFSYAIDPFGDLGVTWPLDVSLISERDASGLSFTLAAQKYTESLG